MNAVKKLPNVVDLVDRLGKIKADIADLESREKEVVEELKSRGVNTYEGKLFSANVFQQTRSKTNWAEVVKEAKVPSKIIAKHTDSNDILVCKVTAR